MPGASQSAASQGGGNPQWLNAGAFLPDPPGIYGNLGRDAVRGLAFNLIHHTNLLAPATGTGIPGITTSGISLGINSKTFGQITTAGDPRILQFAVKLYF